MTMIDAVTTSNWQSLVTGSGRPMKFTPERIEQIKNLVDRGHSRQEIADIVGCTIGSLSVTCSRLNVSLKRRRQVVAGAMPKVVAKPAEDEAPNKVDGGTGEASQVAPSRPRPAREVEFCLRVSYRGQTRDTQLELDDDAIAALSLEAAIQGQTFGEVMRDIIVGWASQE